MTDVYQKDKVYEGPKLNAYPHEELGVARGRAKDPLKYLQATEQRARERQVAIETVKILRKSVIECYRKEGVNHYENCKKEAQDYYDVIIKKDIGQLHPNWQDPKKFDGWS
ncbi:NADH-ubiquinone oxidoreductase subunit 10 [Seminavis robusta]|uniref:NADH-ubiquinone oxidoreductase subunit 10 n=1 Tax=Seminavis robusta TaxID=568900 RepID=A0A9N8HGJ1_9STRA|nr:NADH-ubiquinone oxidoreductase subunit 10 [Seminavis robusta]|eukprot:Sro511_g157500.1 NADH-ubiquinone oxidoreductase subunit 10 (111) ;mRNA; r:48386-48799